MLSSARPRICRFYTTSSVAYAEPSILQDTPQMGKGQPTIQETEEDMIGANSRLKELVKAGSISNARQVFDKMPRRDEVSWTAMISGYVKALDCSEAFSLFSRMWVDPNLRMDPFVISPVLKACAVSTNLKCGESLHGYCVKVGLVNSVFVGSTLLDMYAKTGKTCEGCRVFYEMPIRNVVSWTAIITGLVCAGYSKDGLELFSEMLNDGVVCDSYIFAIALKACADVGALNCGREIHTQTIKKGMDSCSYVVNTLGTMYNKCGKLDYGLSLLGKVMIPDVVSWTSIIAAYVQWGNEALGVQEFMQMWKSSVSPNEYTFAAVISGCANLSRIKWGQQLHALVFHLGLQDFLSVANAIMTMYSKCGELNSTSVVFSEMAMRDIVSWSTIIASFAQAGFGEESFKYLSWMRMDGPEPTEFALASILSACGSMAILKQGKQLHAHVSKVGLLHTPMVQSSLINMYSKCGSIGEAARIFNLAENCDIVSWTAMINGYAEHGHCREAIDLFENAPKIKLRPDSVTFIGVLSACSHAGLVDLGYHYFDLMGDKYRIEASKEHYGCMIDLLCRAGRLSDAEHMILKMPFKQDDVVWSILLRACRVHGDVECARRTAEQIMKFDPNCAGTHITLANIYAEKGRWREAAEVRKLMRLKGLIKEPGWSWVMVDDLVYAFVAGDRSHPRCEDIYGILDLMVSRIEIPNHDMDYLQHGIED